MKPRGLGANRPSHLALAWPLAQNEHVAPFPGSKQRRCMDDMQLLSGSDSRLARPSA
jgi:hypothetical protein